jgi:antitoxin component of MazEF toxin-antitoxin module
VVEEGKVALRISQSFAAETALPSGGDVDLTIDSGRNPRYTLGELVAGITLENRHVEVDMGRSMGNEAW